MILGHPLERFLEQMLMAELLHWLTASCRSGGACRWLGLEIRGGRGWTRVCWWWWGIPIPLVHATHALPQDLAEALEDATRGTRAWCRVRAARGGRATGRRH